MRASRVKTSSAASTSIDAHSATTDKTPPDRGRASAASTTATAAMGKAARSSQRGAAGDANHHHEASEDSMAPSDSERGLPGSAGELALTRRTDDEDAARGDVESLLVAVAERHRRRLAGW